MKGDILLKKATRLALGRKPNWKIVYGLLERSSKKGNPVAIYAIGTWYLHGRYFKKDLIKAFELISSAANMNVPDACHDLAYFYEKLKKDKKKAFEYYLKAAIYGSKRDYREVARCYYYGIGTPKNKTISILWHDRFLEFEKNNSLE